MSCTTCVDLVERLCCYTLSVISSCDPCGPWLPRSLVDSHLCGRQLPTSWLGEATKNCVRALSHLRAALRAVANLGFLSLAEGGLARTRHGKSCLERVGVLLLTLWGHQRRAAARQEEGCPASGNTFLGGDELDSLVVSPLRALVQGYPHAETMGLSPPEATRLLTFVQAVDQCGGAGSASNCP